MFFNITTSFEFNIINILQIRYSPLEQFEIFNFCSATWTTNITTFLILFSFFIFNTIKTNNITIIYFLISMIHAFVENIMNTNIIQKKQNIFILYYYLFLILFFFNLIGLIPFTYTLTSSFLITLSLSLIFFILINIIAIYYNKFFNFGKNFFPTGTPNQIAFLLTPIEYISYIARLFSLAIRLFANMMAGHTLLKILIGFSYALLLTISTVIIAILPWTIITLIFILEILIAMLQAYVFLILISIYINDILAQH